MPKINYPYRAVPARRPLGTHGCSIYRVRNGYVVCDEANQVPAHICPEWDDVVQALRYTLHPEDPIIPAPVTTQLITPPARRDLLRGSELAEILSVSRQAIGQWTRRGMPHIPAGSKPRYRLAEVEAWLKEHGTRQKRRKKTETEEAEKRGNGEAANRGNGEGSEQVETGTEEAAGLRLQAAGEEAGKRGSGEAENQGSGEGVR